MPNFVSLTFVSFPTGYTNIFVFFSVFFIIVFDWKLFTAVFTNQIIIQFMEIFQMLLQLMPFKETFVAFLTLMFTSWIFFVCIKHVPANKEIFWTCNVLPFCCPHLALWREEGKKGWNCGLPFERKLNWISLKGFLYFNSKVCKRLLKKVPISKKITKMQKKNHQPIHFFEKLAMPFHCRAVQVCLEALVP